MVVTVLLLGVLIPIFQTTQAKSDDVRDQLELQVGALRRRDQGRDRRLRRASWTRSRTSQSVELHLQGRGAEELKQRPRQDKTDDRRQLNDNPLPASFKIKPDDPANLDRIRDGAHAAGPERQAAADLARSSRTSSTASRTRSRSSR